MIEQIVKTYNNQKVSEVALQCADSHFKDFPKDIYSQAVYRAERSIAKEFHILDRRWIYNNTKGDAAFKIIPKNYNGATRVIVLPDGATIGNLYIQKSLSEVIDNTDSDNYFFCVRYESDSYVFYYTTPAENDSIEITYISSIAGEEDFSEIDEESNSHIVPEIPDKYYEEILRRSVRYVAKLGIAQYDKEKGAKFQRILSLYTKRDDEVGEQNLGRDDAWLKIKPFQYP